jgi:hypothetical protein
MQIGSAGLVTRGPGTSKLRACVCSFVLLAFAPRAWGQAAETEPSAIADQNEPAGDPAVPPGREPPVQDPAEQDPTEQDPADAVPAPPADEENSLPNEGNSPTERPNEEPPARPARAQKLEEELSGLDQSGSAEKPAGEGQERDTGEGEKLPPGKKRDPVDYDGRPEPQTDAGDIVRWVPRIVFFPLYLVMEYGLRVPIVWTTTRIEEHQITDRIVDFFTWDEGRAALHPIVSLDYGIRPNIGLRFKWREAVPRHDFSATGVVGPDDLWAFAGNVDQKLFRDEEALVRWRGGYVRRPDEVFFGISDPAARCNDVGRGCRFRSAIAEAYLGLVGWEQRLNEVAFAAAFRHARFDNENSDAPALTDEEAADIPGFSDGYQILEPRLHFAVDTRNEDLDFHLGTGVRFEGKTAFAIDVSNPDLRWWSAGSELGGFYDLGLGQVLAMSIYYEGTVNLSWTDSNGVRPEIPFFELPYLGGSDQMKGFLRRRLVGHNALVANFEYSYPITWALDAALFVNLGNTYQDLRSWDIATNYLTYGASLRLASDRSSSFEAILGWGSSRLDAPSFDPFDQFRLTIGVNKGF